MFESIIVREKKKLREMENSTLHGSVGVLETLYGGIDMNHINNGGMECAKQGGSLWLGFSYFFYFYFLD